MNRCDKIGPMKLLAIETATEACSAALLIDGDVTVRYRVEPRKHSELILPMMKSLLAEAELSLGQLDALAFGRGPGGFTGVRIASGVVQGAAYAVDLPVVPVSTLASLAQRGFREHQEKRMLCAFDARMNEVYWGIYQVEDETGLARLKGEESVSSPALVSKPEGNNWQGIGTGWGSYHDQLTAHLGDQMKGSLPDLYCSAFDVALLGADGFKRGEVVSADQASPIYLRNNVAVKPKKNPLLS